MALNTLLGLRDFWDEFRIIGLARPQSIQGGKALLLFKTSKQHTWLVRFTTELSCVLDDIRQSSPEVKWQIPQRELLQGDALMIELTTRDHKPNTGMIDIGRHRNWLYTIALFQDRKVENAVRELITSS